jgi:prepilin-type processing-associated H-X9-DG protein
MMRSRVQVADRERTTRRGITLVEVVVVVVIIGFFLLLVLFALPRQRESARLNDCRRNLMSIGRALVLYDDAASMLPTVPRLDDTAVKEAKSPLKALLTTLELPDLIGLDDSPKAKEKKPPRGPVPTLGRVPGFFCQSDPYAQVGNVPGPVSYRATTGDTPSGSTGAFAPGRKIKLSEIEDGDGRGYTAAFSERLVGNRRADDRAPANYFRSGPVHDDHCPEETSPEWLGDAGSSWAEVGWRSTLYNHALLPNGSPSCIARDGVTGLMGVSSGHLTGVNVLMFDGSVRTVTPRIDERVWKAMATTHSPKEPEYKETP